MEEVIVRIHNLLNRKKAQNKVALISLGDHSFNFPKQQLSYKN